MNYYDMTAETGIDYDLYSCLKYHPQPFTLDEIKKVLAVHEGENDGDDWRWVLSLKDGRFAFLQGGCDYTGWDCQSWATSQFADTPENAARFALGDFPLGDSSPANAGLGHMLDMIGGTYADNFQAVYASLMSQLQSGKSETWREKTDREMGLS